MNNSWMNTLSILKRSSHQNRVWIIGANILSRYNKKFEQSYILVLAFDHPTRTASVEQDREKHSLLINKLNKSWVSVIRLRSRYYVLDNIGQYSPLTTGFAIIGWALFLNVVKAMVTICPLSTLDQPTCMFVF